MASSPFIFVNKTTSAIVIKHEYHPLPCIQESEQLQIVTESTHNVAKGAECAIVCNPLMKDIDEDERYERVVVISRIYVELLHEVVHATTHTIPTAILKGFKKILPPSKPGTEASTNWREKTCIIPLVGAPTDERLFVYPISYSPHTYVTPESLFFFKLLHAVLTGSQEALAILLEEAVTHPFLLEALKDVTLALPQILLHLPDIIRNGIDFVDGKISKKETIPYRIRNGPKDGLCTKEKEALEKRTEVIKNNVKPDGASSPPVIASCTSGGGMRAMIASVGYLTALKDMGVLDMITYVSTLSGSTWSTSKWMNVPNNPFVTNKNLSGTSDCWSANSPAQDSADHDISGLVKTGGVPVPPPAAFKIGIEAIRTGSILIGYAELLALKMGTTDPSYVHLVAGKSDDGKFPIPVYTSCFKDNKDNLQWAEFTPYEIGSTHLSTYFGHNDFQLNAAPTPVLLSHMMAVWGSAFYCTFAQLLEQIPGPSKGLPDWMHKILGTFSLLNGAQVINANYNQKHPGTGRLLPMANQRYIYYRDGGIIANLPIPPMLRPERGVNLLIVLDTSANVKEKPFGELVKAIPSIASKIPENPTYPYTFEAGPDHPAIVYIPIMRNDEYNAAFDPATSCSTFNFEYDEQTVKKLYGLAYYSTKMAKDAINQCILNL